MVHEFSDRMRYGLGALAVALALAVLASAPSTSVALDPGIPQYANKMLSDFSTPTVAPGRDVDFGFHITNPYDQSRTMTHIELTVGIYRYATQETVRDVDSGFKNPPLMEGLSIEKTVSVPDLISNGTFPVDLPIETTGKTPHGSYFSQATYFVRTKITFQFNGDIIPVTLQSRGWFTDEQWTSIVRFSSNQSIVNRTYLKSLGVDGLIPDSSFGLRQPIPIWPLGLVIFACAGSAFMALYYFVLDNPGKYPRLEKRFYHLRGKLSELRGKFKNRR